MQQLRMQTYSRLTPTQILQVARHPARPTFLDVVLNITDEFVELHGDRLGTNDPAIVCGLGTIDGDTFMLIGTFSQRSATTVARPLCCLKTATAMWAEAEGGVGCGGCAGHQKGRNQKENVARNFGMPHPGGYRKALRFMQHADKFGFPILCMIDTPGAPSLLFPSFRLQLLPYSTTTLC
jgi:acetyl-CoA carboxylase carboxyl transferase subunit alpha